MCSPTSLVNFEKYLTDMFVSFSSVLVHGVDASRHGIFLPTCGIHNGQPHLASRSFFEKSKNPNKHVSFRQQTIAYVEPFTLDVFISKQFVSASLTHGVACKQVAISQLDILACLALGHILADQAGKADVYSASYTPRERDKFEGKIEAVVQSLIDSGNDI
ncbi:hypothetical protein EUGRSUZ_L00067 [Eucalyptus grandis]|uniref:Uncharacterized protein n=1 Tax=Eucalyptus grandis TaxID=71139 RepID=A0A058ZW73_EUCGR|nr:hypothetical protein EUGRSUZ_L00067 [Eucalyptus grandis]